MLRLGIVATAAFLALFIGARFFAPNLSQNGFFDWGLLLACTMSPLLSARLRARNVVGIIFFLLGLGLLLFISAFVVMAEVFHDGP